MYMAYQNHSSSRATGFVLAPDPSSTSSSPAFWPSLGLQVEDCVVWRLCTQGLAQLLNLDVTRVRRTLAVGE